MIPSTRAYKTAIAEASVAVKRPITIPPITINSGPSSPVEYVPIILSKLNRLNRCNIKDII